jgi:hypothetical protein
MMTTTEKCPHGARWTTCLHEHPGSEEAIQQRIAARMSDRAAEAILELMVSDLRARGYGERMNDEQASDRHR